MRYIKYFILFISFIFSFSAFSKEEGRQCKNTPRPEGQPPRFCFFSLNGKDESKGMCDGIKDASQNALTQKIPEDQPHTCRLQEGDATKIEIQEYYAENLKREDKPPKENKKIEESFRKMTQDRCDALVISGHHVGYFTGSKQKKRAKENVALTLDFLEKFSCESKECMEWFDNIKMLHLHGSRTWGNSTQTTESKAANLLEEYPGWNPENVDLTALHREYAHTVDTNNPLSKRYLRMFPQASVLAWSADAPEIPDSIQTFITYFTQLGVDGGTGNNTIDGFNKFLEFLNKKDLETSDYEQICKAERIKNIGPGNLKAIWAGKYLGDNVEQEEAGTKQALQADRKAGCDLSQAIDAGDSGQIGSTLNNILQDDGRAEQRIHQNLNRIIHALHLDNSLSPEQRKAFIDQLATSDVFKETLTQKIKGVKLGLVRRADYLALYNKIPFTNDAEALQAAEQTFFEDLKTVFETNKTRQCGNENTLCHNIKKVTAEMLAEIIWKNKLVNAGSAETVQEIANNIAETVEGVEGLKQKFLLNVSLYSSMSADDQNKKAMLAQLQTDAQSLSKKIGEETKGWEYKDNIKESALGILGFGADRALSSEEDSMIDHLRLSSSQ